MQHVALWVLAFGTGGLRDMHASILEKPIVMIPATRMRARTHGHTHMDICYRVCFLAIYDVHALYYMFSCYV
jgi:hypothetical protein